MECGEGGGEVGEEEEDCGCFHVVVRSEEIFFTGGGWNGESGDRSCERLLNVNEIDTFRRRFGAGNAESS